MQCFRSFVSNPRRSLLPDTTRHLNIYGHEPEPLNEEIEAPEVELGGLGDLIGKWDGKAVWKCARCMARNDIDAKACSDCGMSYEESLDHVVRDAMALKTTSTGKMTFGAYSWAARFMMLTAGLVAPVVFLFTIAYEALARLMRRVRPPLS